MGTQVTVTLDSQLKPDYTVSTVLAASVAIDTDELIVWIGADTLAFGASFQVVGVVRAGELIRENGNVTPTTTNVTSVTMPAPGLKPDATVALNGALVAPTEDDVFVGYGSAFQAMPGQSVSAHVKRALEKFIEQRA